jgi:multiple sugar transport system ATP-binding protein
MTMADRVVILHQGVACQTGTPEEVYNNPVDQFVAGFVGSLPMNFIHGRPILHEGRSFFQLGSSKMDLSHIGTDVQLDCSKNSGGLILGIRPEDIYLDEHYSHAVAPSPKITAQVKMVEYLGDSTIVHLEGDIGSFTSRFNKDLRVRKSENVDCVFDLKKLHLFTEEGNKLP